MPLLSGSFGRNPFSSDSRASQHSLAVGGDRSVGRLDEIADASASAVGEVFGGQSGRIDDGQSLGRRFFHFVFDPAAPATAAETMRDNSSRDALSPDTARYRSPNSSRPSCEISPRMSQRPSVSIFSSTKCNTQSRSARSTAMRSISRVRRAVEDRIRLELQIEVQIDPEFLDERAG